MVNTTARHYSTALLELAIETKKVNIFREQAETLLSVMKAEPDLLGLLMSHNLEFSEKEKIIRKIFHEFDPLVQNVICLIVKKNKGHQMFQIFKLFFFAASTELKIKEGIVFSTRPVSPEDLQALSEKVSKRMNIEVHLVNEIKPSLIGGILIQIDDIFIDNSIRGNLQKLKSQVLSFERKMGSI